MNEQQNTKYEIRTTHSRKGRRLTADAKGFTLIELVVAIGIMAVVILFAGNVFKASIGSYRVASAQVEIMQKFRAITDQLNNDFRGLRKDAPMFIWFQKGPNGAGDPNRLDQIMFFADGDFQSIQTYNTNPTSPYNGDKTPQPSGSPVISNLARVYYGQAWSNDPNNNNNLNDPRNIQPYNRVLSRRQHLSIANPDPPELQYWHFPARNPDGSLYFDLVLGQNNWLEHDTNSLSQWQAAAQNPTSVDNIITGCFGTAVSYYGNNRPTVNLADPNTLHLLMAQKVGSFSVQWSYLYQDVSTGLTHIYWWPSIDPDGNSVTLDNDFVSSNAFGFYFNTVAPSSVTNWFPYSGANGVYYPDPLNLLNPSNKPVFPQALKFTFTLYDSRGVFKDGQTFTHIVYLGD